MNAKRKARILIVDDDPGLLRLLTLRLRAENYEVEPKESAAAALTAASRFRPDLVITDLRMDQMDGLELLKELQSRWPGLRVIILTAHGTIPDAVHATQSGAFGFLTKPVDKEQLLEQVQKALKISGFTQSDEEWRSDIITCSTLMEEKLAQAYAIASSEANVLIYGETGTGRKLFAHAIHKASSRRSHPFIEIDCSALEETQLETELFGGQADDRSARKPGALQAAAGGTLLLGEVGSLSPRLQLKLFSALQNGSGHGPGAARIVATAPRDLKQSIERGAFREDLFYRLNGVHIEIPPLAKRREDIPLLVAHFLAELAKETGHRRIYAPEAVELLATAEWPGNIRQLHSVVRQNVALAQTPIINAELAQQSLGGNPSRLPSFDEARDEFMRSYLAQILQITAGNVSQAARLAKRNRTDFYKLLARHQLTPDEFKNR